MTEPVHYVEWIARCCLEGKPISPSDVPPKLKSAMSDTRPYREVTESLLSLADKYLNDSSTELPEGIINYPYLSRFTLDRAIKHLQLDFSPDWQALFLSGRLGLNISEIEGLSKLKEHLERGLEASRSLDSILD